MKKFILALFLLTLIAAAAEVVMLLSLRLNPWQLGAFLEALSLILAAFVALTYSGFTKRLRHWAVESAWAALGVPFLLLIPYFIYALGTGTFSWRAVGKLSAYIAAPTLLLLPDRTRKADRVNWRDFAAMLSLALPVSAHWLGGIWTWPQNIYFFQPLVCVCVGAYGFIVVRNLEGIGYRLGPRKEDVVAGLVNLVGFSLLAIPLGIVLGFIHPHANRISIGQFAFQFFGIYFSIAIPEELLFRGILQNFLARTISRGPRGLYGLLIASVIFGASHLHHPPVPNWRYGILATLAGIFYGNAYQTRQRLSASALTHTLVDTMWHFWF